MTLYLLPNTLGSKRIEDLPASVGEIVRSKIQGLIVESDRGGRLFLSLCKVAEPHKFPLAVMSKNDVSVKACDFYLEPIVKKQEAWGLISDAGLPCIADPGARLVRRARSLKIPVCAVSGPCSITQALMLSGLPGQNFSFHGYLPQNPKERARYLRSCLGKAHTHICIETPYRNPYTFEALLDHLPAHGELCVAIDLMGEQEYVSIRSIASWNQATDLEAVRERLKRVPAIFLFIASF
ncbi:SAM-dependent methyltransferase [Chlamydia sp.]|uniref:SAM-dependent methyltransferase n=1 Tax=Chlamydia sp. TaxID=35827 RepID=UPI0025BB65AB|nr:SAM-dependent methyltransferase [Chlamydia sp.]MBQ8498430.1 SAM-dependent methyltransferase [Chlamydia sp.]